MNWRPSQRALKMKRLSALVCKVPQEETSSKLPKELTGMRQKMIRIGKDEISMKRVTLNRKRRSIEKIRTNRNGLDHEQEERRVNQENGDQIMIKKKGQGLIPGQEKEEKGNRMIEFTVMKELVALDQDLIREEENGEITARMIEDIGMKELIGIDQDLIRGEENGKITSRMIKHTYMKEFIALHQDLIQEKREKNAEVHQ